MENQLFADYPLNQREEMLEANAERMEDMTYAMQLTEEEVYKERSEFSQLAIEISSKEDQLKQVKEEFMAELKPMKDTFKEKLQIIKTKTKSVREKVYVLADFEEKMVGTYNSRGELITQRRMTPEETQMSIHSNRVMKIAQNS